MKIKLDSENFIVAVLHVGNGEGYIEINESLPSDFEFGNFKYIDGQIVQTGFEKRPVPDYIPEPTLEDGVTTTENKVVTIEERIQALEVMELERILGGGF